VQLLDHGRDVVGHAGDHHRAAALSELTRCGATVVVGDVTSQEQIRSLADQVNQLGRLEAIIHNAGGLGAVRVNDGPFRGFDTWWSRRAGRN
jgi:NAD(P)-dependent dehydrogenase (short-subunit alcohol dehydrogenase family)